MTENLRQAAQAVLTEIDALKLDRLHPLAVMAAHLRDELAPPPRAISCGCCTGGCVCWFHQDLRLGIRPSVCAYHAEHGHPGRTEEDHKTVMRTFPLRA